jgi:hypothetical protein
MCSNDGTTIGQVGSRDGSASLQLQSYYIIIYNIYTYPCMLYMILHAISRGDRVVPIFLKTTCQKHDVAQNVCVCARVLAFTRVQWIEQTLLTDKKLETA